MNGLVVAGAGAVAVVEVTIGYTTTHLIPVEDDATQTANPEKTDEDEDEEG